MSDYYKVLRQAYNQGEVIRTKLDTLIPYSEHAGKTGGYQGTTIQYDSKGEAKNIKIFQGWLDNSHQSVLKEAIAALKPDQLFTEYKECRIKTADYEKLVVETSQPSYEGKPLEERVKDASNWSTLAIYPDHIRPPEMSNAAPAAAVGGAPAGGGGFNLKGVQTGHAINGAYRLLTPAAAKDSAKVIAAAKAIHELSREVEEKYKISSGLSTRDVGAAAGHAVLNACSLCKTVEEVEDTAIAILADVTQAVSDYIHGVKPKATPEVKKEAPKKEDTPPVDSYDDSDVPF